MDYVLGPHMGFINNGIVIDEPVNLVSPYALFRLSERTFNQPLTTHRKVNFAFVGCTTLGEYKYIAWFKSQVAISLPVVDMIRREINVVFDDQWDEDVFQCLEQFPQGFIVCSWMTWKDPGGRMRQRIRQVANINAPGENFTHVPPGTGHSYTFIIMKSNELLDSIVYRRFAECLYTNPTVIESEDTLQLVIDTDGVIKFFRCYESRFGCPLAENLRVLNGWGTIIGGRASGMIWWEPLEEGTPASGPFRGVSSVINNSTRAFTMTEITSVPLETVQDANSFATYPYTFGIREVTSRGRTHNHTVRWDETIDFETVD
jgi:hypothetical protein